MVRVKETTASLVIAASSLMLACGDMPLDEQGEITETTQNATLVTTTVYSVAVTAGTRSHDGTVSRIWVRIYSDDLNQWTSWKSIAGGFQRGQTKSASFVISPFFTNVSKIELWEGGSDGMGASVRGMRAPGDGLVSFGPGLWWVKGGARTFNRSSSNPAAIINNCQDPQKVDVCNRFASACESAKRASPTFVCGCTATTCCSGKDCK